VNTFKGIAAGPMKVLAALTLALAFISCTAATPASPETSASPTASARTSPSELASPPQATGPALTERFTSAMHGMSISYPAGWTTRPATEPWASESLFRFEDSVGDFLYDPLLTDHLFLGLASQPIADRSADTWAAELLALEGCPSSDEVVVDGTVGLVAPDCGMVLVAREDRGYLIWLYSSTDDQDLGYDPVEWFRQILATVSLDPQ